MDSPLAAAIGFIRRFPVETILLTVALALALGSACIYLGQNDIQGSATTETIKTPTSDTNKTITVDVEGAVGNPGILEMKSGARIGDAVAAAGGLSGEADAGFYRRNFNQARYLADQEKLYVPSREEIASGVFPENRQFLELISPQEPAASAFAASTIVHINTADEAELETLPGVGQATAAKIVKLRPYASVQEMLTKKAVNKNVFEQIKQMIAL